MKPVYYLLAAAILAIIIMIFLWPSGEPYDSSAWKKTIAEKDERLKAYEQRDKEHLEKIKSDSLQSIKNKETYESNVKGLTSTITKLKANPKVITILKENPEVDSLVRAQDSLIAEQNLRIYSLEKEATELRIDITELNYSFQQQIAEHKGKYEATVAENEKLQKELNKKNKKSLGEILLKVGEHALSGLAGFVLGKAG
jgi:hypothetical protein